VFFLFFYARQHVASLSYRLGVCLFVRLSVRPSARYTL